jgi:hypothetical protein
MPVVRHRPNKGTWGSGQLVIVGAISFIAVLALMSWFTGEASEGTGAQVVASGSGTYVTDPSLHALVQFVLWLLQHSTVMRAAVCAVVNCRTEWSSLYQPCSQQTNNPPG